jgi:hypothetical protein
VSGTTDTILSGDNGNIIYYTNASGCAVTVPAGLWSGTGATFQTALIPSAGAGTVSISPAAGLSTISTPSGLNTCAGAGAPLVIAFMTTTVFAVTGNAVL